MKKLLRPLILVNIGGLLYYVLEIIWRGYSHWTMFVLGGLCFYLIGEINEYLPWEMTLYKQIMIGDSIVTTLEFVTGCIVNLWLKWDVWDYSSLPFNLFGQICLLYVLLWVPVVLIAIFLDDWIRYFLFKEEKPHYKI